MQPGDLLKLLLGLNKAQLLLPSSPTPPSVSQSHFVSFPLPLFVSLCLSLAQDWLLLFQVSAKSYLSRKAFPETSWWNVHFSCGLSSSAVAAFPRVPHGTTIIHHKFCVDLFIPHTDLWALWGWVTSIYSPVYPPQPAQDLAHTWKLIKCFLSE